MGAGRGGSHLTGVATRPVEPPAPLIPGSLGVLGGTFDPIHHGHLAIAEEAREALGLERVLFVPAAVPPHRTAPPGASAEDRARMVELATAGNSAFALSRIELERAGPSFTVDTLAAIGRERDGLPELVFILSSEALADLPTREGLRAQVVGAVQGPLAQLVGLLQAPQRELAYILAERGKDAAAE